MWASIRKRVPPPAQAGTARRHECQAANVRQKVATAAHHGLSLSLRRGLLSSESTTNGSRRIRARQTHNPLVMHVPLPRAGPPPSKGVDLGDRDPTLRQESDRLRISQPVARREPAGRPCAAVVSRAPLWSAALCRSCHRCRPRARRSTSATSIEGGPGSGDHTGRGSSGGQPGASSSRSILTTS